jgi:predicted NBD/HSP70 family sugar kinase
VKIVSTVRTDRFYLGLDVGRTIRGALTGASGAIIRQARVVSEVSNPRIFINQLIEIINQLAARPPPPASAGPA